MQMGGDLVAAPRSSRWWATRGGAGLLARGEGAGRPTLMALICWQEAKRGRILYPGRGRPGRSDSCSQMIFQ